jgi:tetratricopeptide (TPR) repeat protein
MKYLLHLCIAVPLALVLGVAGAQNAPEVDKFHNGNYVTPEERALIAASRESLLHCSQCLAQARAALKKNDVKKAEVFLTQALSFDRDDGEACLRLAEMHNRAKQPSAVVADLEPIVNPRPGSGSSVGSDISVRMLYVLAQLDCGNWGAAAACYQKSFRIGEEWHLPGGRPRHTFPNVQFSPDNPDVLGLRAQAYLIRGGYSPEFVEEQDKPPYMLENLRQALKYNPKSMDANYLSGFMLAKMERFAEARAAYEKAMRLASKEARPEVKQALDALKVQEDTKRENEARVKANRQANPN